MCWKPVAKGFGAPVRHMIVCLSCGEELRPAMKSTGRQKEVASIVRGRAM